MLNWIFTYGTLMRGIPSRFGNYLEANGMFVGEAQMPGRLYDLGNYPGLVYDEDCGRLITGHIFEIVHAARVLEQLDRYEGIDPGSPPPHEYRRVIRPALWKGKRVACWVYEYALDPTGLPEITEPSYLHYWQKQASHRDFVLQDSGRGDRR